MRAKTPSIPVIRRLAEGRGGQQDEAPYVNGDKSRGWVKQPVIGMLGPDPQKQRMGQPHKGISNMDADYLRGKQVHVGNHGKINAQLEVEVVEAATRLVRDFIERRHKVQADAQAESNAEHARRNTRPPLIWCPVNPFARYREHGALELGWKLIRPGRTKGELHYDSIPRRVDGNYDLRALRKHSLPFEWDMVRECEAKATQLRADWKQVVAVRVALRQLVRDERERYAGA